MSISDKARKMLWARSGNRCALCRRLLVMSVEGDDNLSIVGDECHIVAQEKGGPRSTLPIPGGDLDGYDNLILLCKIHHKCCDDHPDVYSVERIVNIKGKHEKWVEMSLAGKKAPASSAFLMRVTTGKDLMNLLIGSHLYEHDHDELNTKEEVELIGGFLQNAHDWGDIGSDLEAGAGVSAAFSMKQDLENLDRHGFWVFGGNRFAKYSLKESGESLTMRIAMLRVVRRGSAEIVELI